MNNLEYLNKIVTIKIDRSMGSKHPKHGFIYPINYGYVPNTVQTLATQNSIRILMCIVPALGIILAYVVFKTKYKLNDEFMKKVISKITGSSTSSEQE